MFITYLLASRFYYSLIHFFFFNDTATTEIYTLSLHDALPITWMVCEVVVVCPTPQPVSATIIRDRKSTRLNSSHRCISYAVFCLKKKNNPSVVGEGTLISDRATMINSQNDQVVMHSMAQERQA